MLFSPACNAVSHDVEQKSVVLYPGFQRILFSYRYWWFAAKPRQPGAKRREKRMTSGHRSYRSHFHAILGSYYLIKKVWSLCACLFSLTLTAEIWSYMTLRLICYAWKRNCEKAYLKRKVLLKILTNSFPPQKKHFRFQVYKKDRSQLRSTHSVWF